MFKSYLFGTAAALLVSFSAQAQVNQYVALKGVIARPSIDTSMTFSDLSGANSEKYTYDWDETTGGVRLAYGVQVPVWGGAFRPEIELGWNADLEKKGNDADTGDKEKIDVSSYSAFLNVYYDIHTGTVVTPYIGGGVGYAHVKSKYTYRNDIFDDAADFKASSGTFAWNVGAGVAVALTDHLSLDVGYKFTDYGSVDKTVSYPMWDEKQKFETELQAHEATIGLRLTF